MRTPLLLTALLLAACHPRPHDPRVLRAYPGSLVPSTEIPGAFVLRQHVVAQPEGEEVSFDAVLQNHAGTFTLLGLTPFGTRAFLMQQRGTEVEFTSFVPRDLPFPPRYMLLDVHRALFIGLPSAPLPDGPHTGIRDGEEIRELWAAGRLRERTFRRLDGAPPGVITARYEGGMIPGRPPERIEYHNGWFGYRLTVSTVSFEPIEPEAVAAPPRAASIPLDSPHRAGRSVPMIRTREDFTRRLPTGVSA